jgi:hypothetical protein
MQPQRRARGQHHTPRTKRRKTTGSQATLSRQLRRTAPPPGGPARRCTLARDGHTGQRTGRTREAHAAGKPTLPPSPLIRWHTLPVSPRCHRHSYTVRSVYLLRSILLPFRTPTNVFHHEPIKKKGSIFASDNKTLMALGRQSYADEGFTPVVNKEERTRRRLQLAAGAAAVMIGAVALCAVVFSDSTMGVVSLQEVSVRPLRACKPPCLCSEHKKRPRGHEESKLRSRPPCGLKEAVCLLRVASPVSPQSSSVPVLRARGQHVGLTASLDDAGCCGTRCGCRRCARRWRPCDHFP